MTRPGTTQPDWAERFRRIIALESEHGYDDSAVIGGLDLFLRRWQADIQAQPSSLPDAPLLLRQDYSSMSPEQRRTWAARLLRSIDHGVPEPQAPPHRDEAARKPEPPAREPPPRPASAAPGIPRTLEKPPPAYGLPPAGSP